MNLIHALAGMGGLLIAVAFVFAFCLVLLILNRQPPKHPQRATAPESDDPVTPERRFAHPEDSLAALATLARLPQYLARRDGVLVNSLSGHRIDRCPCGDPPAAHLRIRWWDDESLALVSMSSLSKFVEAQQRAAQWLNAAASVGSLPTVGINAHSTATASPDSEESSS